MHKIFFFILFMILLHHIYNLKKIENHQENFETFNSLKTFDNRLTNNIQVIFIQKTKNCKNIHLMDLLLQ